MSEKYNFIMDPSGDVLLTLISPDALFAVWEDAGISKTDEQALDPDLNLIHALPPLPEVVTFLLSSRHLSLASPVLKTMLSGGWMEGVKVDSKSPYELTAESWSTEAFAMVMNIIHGRWSLVPRTVSLEILAKIAVIVDYYDIREPLQLISSLWMKEFVASSVPTSLCRELVLWTLISWVFKDKALFRQATKIAILQSTHELNIPSDIPIPSSIIAEINTRRRESMEDLADGLKDLIQGYTSGRYGCDFECSCMQLGALMKGLNRLKFVDGNSLDASFGDSSLVDVVEKLRTIKSPTWTKVPTKCSCYNRGYYVSTPCPTCPKAHACSLDSLAFGFQEVRFGVCEAAITSTSNLKRALGQDARRLAEKLEGKTVVDLQEFEFPVSCRPS